MQRVAQKNQEQVLDAQGKPNQGLSPEEVDGRFGLHWDPVVDLLQVPDFSGVYVLFFPDQRKHVALTPNLFRSLRQHWMAPGRKFHAFSWRAFSQKDEAQRYVAKMQQKEYETLWEGF